jgi:conjugal transfer/entry exclusion protein
MQYESPLVPKEVSSQVSPQQVADQQKQIQDQASQLQNVAQATPPPPPSQTGQLNVTGTWNGAFNGLQYIIYQQGAAISIEEYVAQYGPQYGATAYGTGTISGQTIHVNYQTIYQTFGEMTLVASPDGRQLSGQTLDRMTGLTQAISMVR